MKNLLIVGHSPQSDSSYGHIIRQIALAVSKEYSVTCLCVKPGPQASLLPNYDLTGIELIPLQGNLSEYDSSDGYDTFCYHYCNRGIFPDIVLLVDDAYNMFRWAVSPYKHKFTLIMYSPIDGYPYTFSYVATLNAADHVVFYTKESAEHVVNSIANSELENIGVKQYSIIPAGADPLVFRPLGADEQSKLRAKEYGTYLGILLFFIGNNQPRKHNWQQVEILARLRRGMYWRCDSCGGILRGRHLYADEDILRRDILATLPVSKTCPFCGKESIIPGEPVQAKLRYHTSVISPTMVSGGFTPQWNLPLITRSFGIDPKDVLYTKFPQDKPATIPDVEINELYNSHDFLLYTSGGEGFGMPTIEATLAGMPVLYSNFSVHAQLMRNVGVPIEIKATIPSNGTAVHRALADPHDAIARILEYRPGTDNYNDLKNNISNKIKHFTEQYSWERIGEQWLETIGSAKKTQKKTIVVI